MITNVWFCMCEVYSIELVTDMAEFGIGPTACKVSRVEVFDYNKCIFCKTLDLPRKASSGITFETM